MRQKMRTFCVRIFAFKCSRTWIKCFLTAILAVGSTLVFLALSAFQPAFTDIQSYEVQQKYDKKQLRDSSSFDGANPQRGQSSLDGHQKAWFLRQTFERKLAGDVTTVRHRQMTSRDVIRSNMTYNNDVDGSNGAHGNEKVKNKSMMSTGDVNRNNASKSWLPQKPPRMILPDDCFHGLLKYVDPTCDLGTFCTEAWREEDVLCHVFLRQNGFTPTPGQCSLPKDTQNTTERTHKGDNLVPRIAFYVLVSPSCAEPFYFEFMHYLSVVSAKRYIKPLAIYVLGNCAPVGYWWSRVLSDISDVRFIYRPRPTITKDGYVKWIAHLSDVIRLQVLLVNGGIYLDTDMIVLRPLDPLFKHPLTMGLVDINTGMGNALILAAKGSVFLRDWYAGYTKFDPMNFHENGMWTALRMWLRDPESVHLESERFYSPNWFEAEKLFDKPGYDMSQSYAVHIWHRHSAVPKDPVQIGQLNTTLGEIFRKIYYGR